MTTATELNEFPGIYDELNRKTLAHLITLVEERERGLLTSGELRVAVRAVFACTAGLTSVEIDQFVCEIDTDSPHARLCPLVFVGGAGEQRSLIVVIHDRLAHKSTLLRITGAMQASIVDMGAQIDPAFAMNAGIVRVKEQFKTAGFKQLTGD